ncbi:NB-ARC domain-containing protein [Streptomyces sp. NPDC002536]
MDGTENTIAGATIWGTAIQGRDIQYHAAPEAPTPRQLAPEPQKYVNHRRIFATLTRAVAERTAGTAPLVLLLIGMPGVGKTATALRLLHALSDDFPGGQLQADMSPQGPLCPRDPVAVLQGFVRALTSHQPDATLPADPGELAAHYRSLTSARPVLVLLDDVVNAGQVRALLPGHPGSVVVVTSRTPLAGLQASHCMMRVPLGALKPKASKELFEAVAGPGVMERPLLDGVLHACAGLPLAVRIAGARASELRDMGEDPAGLARELIDRSTRLEALAVPDDLSVAQVFDVVYRSLDKDAAALYRALGLHPTPEFSRELVQRLAEAPDDVRTLVREKLLDPAGDGRLRMHRLVHDHARAAADAGGPDGTVERCIDWYLTLAAAVERLVSDRWRHGQVFTRTDLPAFPDVNTALDALEPDRANAVAVVELAHTAGHYEAAWQLCEALRGFFYRRKYHTDWIEVCRQGLDAAGRTGDPVAVARMHYELAFALADRGEGDDCAASREHYEHALREATMATHARTVSTALEGLGLLALRAGDARTAADRFERAVGALDGIDHPRGRALLTFHLGRARSAECRHQDAAELLLQARSLFAALPDPFNEAKALWHYAQARQRADRLDEALEPLDASVALMRTCGAPKELADVLLMRGDVRTAQGEHQAAGGDWREAAELYKRLGCGAEEQAARERRVTG